MPPFAVSPVSATMHPGRADREGECMNRKAPQHAPLVADNLALDFVNTSTGRLSSRDWSDALTDAVGMVAWLRYAEAIDEVRFRDMTRVVADDEGQSRIFLASALRLRGALAALFAAVASGRMPDRDDIEVLEAVLSEARTAERVTWTPEGLRSVVSVDPDALRDGLWPIARAAEEILTSGAPRRVKTCGSPTCQWMFLDTSKNASRRWCQMQLCGNREKGRRRLKRERAQPECTAV